MSDTPPLSPEVLDLIPRLGTGRVEAPQGFLMDAAGVLTRRSIHGGSDSDPGLVHYRANPGSWEWTPLTWAVMTAGDSLTAVELGAGWGPWISRAYALARTLGIETRKVYGVEAEPTHFGYLTRHMEDNGIAPQERVLFEGLSAAQSGVALFPITETPDKSWGLRQVGPAGATREAVLQQMQATAVPGEEGVYTLPRSPHRYQVQESISLADLIGDEPKVDFMHVDIQGSEGEVIPAAMDLLTERFRVVAIGTHSHEIEATLRESFAAAGWVCHHDSEQHHDDKGMLRDGHQVWRNPRFGPAPPVAAEAADRVEAR